MSIEEIEKLLEAVMVAHGKPVTEKQLLELFDEDNQPAVADLREALANLQERYSERGFNLVEVASGYMFQTNKEYGFLISKLWEEKPARYSKALLETLALIAYRQPITRGEIEQIRGVSISASIFKTLQDDRNWIRVVGHKDVPGKPGLYATTKLFLDYFGVKSLDELPPLPEIMKLGEDEDDAAKERAVKPEQLEMDELDQRPDNYPKDVEVQQDVEPEEMEQSMEQSEEIEEHAELEQPEDDLTDYANLIDEDDCENNFNEESLPEEVVEEISEEICEELSEEDDLMNYINAEQEQELEQE